jgi:uncharacterized Zn finger protein
MEWIIVDLKKRIMKELEKPISVKIKNYINKFFETKEYEDKITGKVEGNYGIYNVSIVFKDDRLDHRCSCYLGGKCHHSNALAYTYVYSPSIFEKVEKIDLLEIDNLKEYIDQFTLEELLSKIKKAGISQKKFAESIGMIPRHLTSIKSCELSNRFYHELGQQNLLACGL